MANALSGLFQRPPEREHNRITALLKEQNPGLLGGQTLPRAARNLLSSLGSAALGGIEAITHPVETVGSLARLGIGAAEHALGVKEPTEEMQAASQVKEDFLKKWTTVEGFNEAVAEDPGGMLLSALGGIPGKATEAVAIAKTAKAAERAADVIAPVKSLGEMGDRVLAARAQQATQVG